ncbi:MAG: hypothetical protein HY000_37965 [Planctomycetes bacterium]|nr:hypothetical protein [Planctomycetia bacterium]MBI3468826.1 hypothetical protein [Planctomycetota bacterium]
MGLLLSQARDEVCHAAPPPDLSQVLKDWQGLRDRVHGVQYEVHLTHFVAKGQFEGEPSADMALDERRQYYVDFRGNRVRLEARYPEYDRSDHRFNSRAVICLFDGQEVQIFRPRAENVDLQEERLQYEWELTVNTDISLLDLFTPPDVAVLLAHVCHEHRRSDLSSRQLRLPLDASLYRLVGEAVVANRRCAVVERRGQGGDPSSYRWWADLDGDGRVLRAQGFYKDRERMRIDLEYQPSEPIPVLKGYAVFQFGSDGAMRQLYRANVVSYSVNPDFSSVEFHVQPRPGMYAFSASTETYHVIDEQGRLGKQLREVREERERIAWRWWRWTIASALVLAVCTAAACYLLLRRRR